MSDAKVNKRTWYDIGSDVNWIDYGGRWARHIEGSRYHVIRFDNCMHSDNRVAGYHCDLQEVDIDSPRLIEALKFCGYDDPHRTEECQLPLNQVEVLASYGAAAPLWQASSRNAHALVRKAKGESKRIQRDASAYEQAMDRPVNAIGSTAREYAAGDILSGVLRGVADGDPKAELMLKLGVR